MVKCGALHFDGNNLKRVQATMYALDQYGKLINIGKLHSANRMLISVGAYDYRKCPKSRSKQSNLTIHKLNKYVNF